MDLGSVQIHYIMYFMRGSRWGGRKLYVLQPIDLQLLIDKSTAN